MTEPPRPVLVQTETVLTRAAGCMSSVTKLLISQAQRVDESSGAGLLKLGGEGYRVWMQVCCPS
jgi:hypothetical protein